MSVYIPPATRKLVIARAGYRCEYCRILEYLSSYLIMLTILLVFNMVDQTHLIILLILVRLAIGKKDQTSAPYLNLAVQLFLCSTLVLKIGLSILKPLMVCLDH